MHWPLFSLTVNFSRSYIIQFGSLFLYHKLRYKLLSNSLSLPLEGDCHTFFFNCLLRRFWVFFLSHIIGVACYKVTGVSH